MKLEDYVKQTLLQIMRAVNTAKTESPLAIAPGYVEGRAIEDPQFVKFDIAVTVHTETGGGIEVFSIADFKAGRNSESTNRIQFEVPVYFQANKPTGEGT